MKIKTIEFYKGQSIGDSQSENTKLLFINEFPDYKDLEISTKLFNNEADFLENALNNVLPGGTYNALLCAMLKRKQGHLVVSFGDKEKTGER